MSALNYACWAWKSDDGAVRHIGFGPYEKSHPAAVKWAGRFDDDSDLHLWLQSLPEEPTREICGATIMGKRIARALATVYRGRYTTLLDSRGPMSYAGGGDPREVVYFPDDDMCSISIFSSVREAARATNVNPSNITRKCKNPANFEWYYMENDE